MGHLPFSHAAEKELLPHGWNHERLTVEILRHSEIAEELRKAKPPVDPEDVIDAAWDYRKRVEFDPSFSMSPWKILLNEILTGNTFGADRIDYLLRDSRHAGVAYGRFDPDRLIGGLRIVIDPEIDEIALGLDIGGIHAAEALLLARYFMYTQVYLHDVRRAYDSHLKDFLKQWLPGSRFTEDWRDLLKVTDNEILAALLISAADAANPLNGLAARLMNRQHYRTVYELVSAHKRRCPTILEDVFTFAQQEFGPDGVRSDYYSPKSEPNDFLVLTEDGSVESSMQVSGVIANVPVTEIGFIFVDPAIKSDAKRKIDAFVKQRLAATMIPAAKKGD